MRYELRMWSATGQLVFEAGPARTAQYHFVRGFEAGSPGFFDCNFLETKTAGALVIPKGGNYFQGWSETFEVNSFSRGTPLLPAIWRDTTANRIQWPGGDESRPIDILALELS